MRGATTQHRFFSINAKVCIDLNHRGLVIADDILLLAPSVHGLEKLLRICEKGLDLLDVIINTRNHVVYVLGLELMLHMPPCVYYELRPVWRFRG